MSSIPVPCSKSNGVLSCVSIIAQSCAIDKVYLVSGLQNALWKCHFLSELLLLSLCCLNVLTYNLSQELLIQKMQFFRTANLPRPKHCHQNCFLREALNRKNYRWIQKIFVFWEFNKNISFSTKFQYWISWKTNNLRFANSSLQYILLKMTINLPASKMKN